MYDNPSLYRSKTEGVEVCVRPFYAKELSQPHNNKYVFVYRIKIINHNINSIQLITREWNIVEEDGTQHYLEGEGVIGQQPIIEPGQNFEYASQAVLFKKSGIMYGFYHCINLRTNEYMEIEIPAFSLDVTA
jgi:ApaG protein